MIRSKDKTSKVENLKDLFKGRSAVFIDAANLEKSVADLGTKPPNIKSLKKEFLWKALPKGYFKVDYKKLYKFFKQYTKSASISFYTARFNTQTHDDFLTFLKNNGYRLVTKPIKTIRGRSVVITCDKCGRKINIPNERKANFDVEIAVDAVSWINNYDTLILFSGDSDFAYLLNFLKRRNKKVMVISERWHVSGELVRAADIYRDLHTFKNKFIVIRKQKSRP